ncbi:hypothetical protein BCE_1180 [Bacillus cereus ATCC 10987]|jgi:hypothetical protein|uniref:Uncharacterized protein n=2 Tax=Bacillus cereus group TaxID=86661 RepID=Q73C86_BACC1|nr:hypothetical protein BCE_1180 [Bacillus cereus ATCC 10987]SME14929.1 hypothetical protein BACERE00191_03383 [Bacillus pacificus]
MKKKYSCKKGVQLYLKWIKYFLHNVMVVLYPFFFLISPYFMCRLNKRIGITTIYRET